MILTDLLSALLQLVAFALLPFIVYLISYKTLKGFFRYVGVYQTHYSSARLALVAGLILGITGTVSMYINPDIRALAVGKTTVPGQIKQAASPLIRVLLILIIALIKTALAEELLFRGFIAKRLMDWLGYNIGNLAQAFLFGALHVLLFLTVPGVSRAFLAFSFLLPGTAGYLAGFLNEKTGKGSIYPGWILHGLMNLISYSFLVFI